MNGAADEAMGNGQLLLVDDDVNLAEEIIEFGQWNDLNISYAKNAYVCLETIRRYPEIELVIMDLRLPDVLGTELIRMIRTEFKDRPWLQFIVLTGFADLESAREVIKLGAVDMLNKPFQPREFTTAAHKGLVRARRARSGPIQPGDIITADDFDKAHGWPDQASSWYQRLHQASRQRSRLFPADLFSDPCWDMVLELYLAEFEQEDADDA